MLVFIFKKYLEHIRLLCGLLGTFVLGFKARIDPCFICHLCTVDSKDLPCSPTLHLSHFDPLTFSSIGGTQTHATVCALFVQVTPARLVFKYSMYLSLVKAKMESTS